MGRTTTNNAANNSTPPPPHRRRAGTALDDFAHRKGVTKAIQDYRHRQTKKRTETAKALRHYKKTMKQQGYEAGKGASRKRNDTDGASNSGDATPTKKKKNHKTNSFAKSLQKQRSNQTKAQEAAAQREANEKERTKKIKERRRRSKQMRQRTSKGQPVMKHVIGDILRKLEREQEHEKQGKEEEEN